MDNRPEIKSFKPEKVKIIVESKETKDLLECLDILEKHAVHIDSGNNADVVFAKGTQFENVCMKRNKENPAMKCNDVDTELKLQAEVHALGVRSAMPLLSFKSGGRDFILMERLNGHSLKKVLQDQDLLPDCFDYETFFKSLEEQMSLMHKGGIYHRMLESGNVLVNSTDGLADILDFGTAIGESSGTELTYQHDVQVYNPQTGKYSPKFGALLNDIKAVNDLRELAKTLMMRKKNAA